MTVGHRALICIKSLAKSNKKEEYNKKVFFSQKNKDIVGFFLKDFCPFSFIACFLYERLVVIADWEGILLRQP